MATRYGVQFEDLMAEVCREFGARLVRSWDREAEKEEVKRFVAEAVENFFKGTHATVTEKVVIASPVKAKAPSKKKAKAEPEPEAEIAVESPKKKGTKSKAPAKAKPKAKEVAKKTGDKPKCEATTAKGAPCSKCALDGEVFCSVHLKSKTTKKGDAPAVAKGKGGKGITKRIGFVGQDCANAGTAHRTRNKPGIHFMSPPRGFRCAGVPSGGDHPAEFDRSQTPAASGPLGSIHFSGRTLR